MSEFLIYYRKVDPTTWAYLSSLLMIGLYFKFNRFWSVRNLDLVLLILLAPGLLMVHMGRQQRLAAAAAIGSGKSSIQYVTVDPPIIAALKPVTSSVTSSAPAIGNSAELLSAADVPALPATGSSSSEPTSTQASETPAEPSVATAGTETPLPSTAGGDSGTTLNSSTAPEAVAPLSAGESLGAAPENEAGAKETKEKTASARGRATEYAGYLTLFGVLLVLLVRLLLDPTMVRRPLLEPNLTSGGLLFLGCALFLFLMTNVISSKLTADELRGARGAEALLTRHDSASSSGQTLEDYRRHGPGYSLLHVLPSIATMPFVHSADERQVVAYAPAARTMAILAHLAVVSGLIIIGYWHFENIKMGIGAATLYLMLPYTAQMTGHVDHALPAALLMWAIVFYRRPAVAGIFIGLAMGVLYYPLFLLPLWISFYWQRGVGRFLAGVLSSLSVIALSLLFVSEDFASYCTRLQQMFGLWMPVTKGLDGIWGLGWDPYYRLPVIAACVAMSGGLAIWPAQKNLGTLLSCSAAMMVAVQFWHGYGGGLYLAWFLPLLLLTIFRPNLEDRVALTVLGEGWFIRRRMKLAQINRAA